MKKIICVCLTLMFVCFVSACGAGTTVEPTVRNVKFSAKLLEDGSECICTFDGDGNMTAISLKPENCEGMQSFYTPEGKKTTYLGIEYESGSAQEEQSVSDFVYEAFCSVDSRAQKSGTLYHVSVKKDANTYDLYFTPMGLPNKMTVNKQTEIEFFDVTPEK